MALPKAVQLAVKAADDAYAGAYVQPVDQHLQPEGTPADTAGVVDILPTEQAQTDVPAENTVAAEVQTPKAEPDYKQMYNTLRGKYDAEVPALAAQVKNLGTDLSDTQSVLSALNSDGEFQPAAKVELLTESEIENYGPELVEIMRKAAREEFQPYIDGLQQQNSNIHKQLGTVATNAGEHARQRMYDALTLAVPSWREVNNNSEFLDSLNEVDILSGQPKQVLLTHAFENNDADRVVVFFKQYVEHTSSGSATPEVTSAQPAAGSEPAANGLETLVAPGNSRGSEVTTGAQEQTKSIWKESEIAAFYDDCRKGKFKSSPEERDRIEQDIIAAASELGRVVKG